jgi:hypothetical protein
MQNLDQVLVMMVNRGFGHQHFLHATLPKIRRARQMIERIKPGCSLEVDGGIDVTNAPAGGCRGSRRGGGRIGDFQSQGKSHRPTERLRPQYGSNWKDVVQLAMIGLDRCQDGAGGLWMLEPTAASGLGGRLLP